jgi:hypothetical protein
MSNKSSKESCDVPESDNLFENLYRKYPLPFAIIIVLQIIISLCAFVLAWDCNRMSSGILRILVTIVATIFSEFYIIYYAIYHVLMGFQCYLPSEVVTSVPRFLPPL